MPGSTRKARATFRLRTLVAAGAAAVTLAPLVIGTSAAEAAPIAISVPQSAVGARYAAEDCASGWLGPALGP